MGGGTAAKATYTGGPGGRFSVTLMAAMGQIERINRENFLNDNDNLTGLIGGRILIQTEGRNTLADRVVHLDQIDFDRLERFGQ